MERDAAPVPPPTDARIRDAGGNEGGEPDPVGARRHRRAYEAPALRQVAVVRGTTSMSFPYGSD